MKLLYTALGTLLMTSLSFHAGALTFEDQACLRNPNQCRDFIEEPIPDFVCETTVRFVESASPCNFTNEISVHVNNAEADTDTGCFDTIIIRQICSE